jgi:nucleoside phosphorylase
MGMVSTALVSAKIIEAFRPRVLAMAGICAGVRGKANLGDVILVDPSWDYQSGKRTEDGQGSSFAIAPHQIAVQPQVRARFDQLRADRNALAAIENGWSGGSAPSHPLRLIVGPVACGSAVLADADLMTEIRKQHRELCGVEMEVYGAYSAAMTASAPRPAVFAVKAVCDFGDADKNDSAQRYAAYTSANVLRRFVENYFDDIRRGFS